MPRFFNFAKFLNSVSQGCAHLSTSFQGESTSVIIVSGSVGRTGNHHPRGCLACFHPNLAMIIGEYNRFWSSQWASAWNLYSGELFSHTLSGCFWFGSGPDASMGHSRILLATLLEKETCEIGVWGQSCLRVPALAKELLTR